MDDQNSDKNKTTGFNWYMAKRLVIASLLIILVVWAFGSAPKSTAPDADKAHDDAKATEEHAGAASPAEAIQAGVETEQKTGKAHTDDMAASRQNTPNTVPHTTPSRQHDADTASHAEQAAKSAHTAAAAESHRTPGTTSPAQASSKDTHSDSELQEPQVPNRHKEAPPSGKNARQRDHAGQAPVHGAHPETLHKDLPTGIAFVKATIVPIDHELNKRFWGWRPNDIINFTDNVNNYQLGVLEVTRRTVVLLAERISRTGTTDAFNRNLENSMNWLMVKADRYWFPAPESKYKESIKELEAYKEELLQGRGSFYTRADNLIPLLSSYEDLLGSCDENLVKQTNEEGSRVSIFKADDYFFYAKGVASSMATILEAVHHDFHKTLESRNATELLHHALESCRQAAALDPLLITNGDLDGILANHRANMAAPISHARFYIGQLVKTLST